MKRDDDLLNKVKVVVKRTMPDAEIILYGSRARGDARSHSDWDLLILLNLQNISFDFERKFMNDLYEIEIETGEVITPLIYTKKDWYERHATTPLFENIQKEGIRIY